ncbi:hypothetical protein ACSMDF_16950 [Yersinia enterocolitica]|jgi:hypothetical protein|uniref:Uncharacterized protein n=2 Tax=Yersinia TaxID=629 RepID=A0AAI8ZRJ1_YERFR|nr:MULTISPECIES: hypothetical protein [Yersinia]MCB5317814.1 hypothetical protein [Yersinia massiliensis]MDN0127488.1 hypothetical protein [Yersinia massiliensis]QKJ11627.1 hypothetical protein HRD68_13385 [Yersinia massiliensis]CFR02586.1 Uncharacterised protein [Yersinia frederiksenii]CFR27158.1 Uncharacterised protein [Yersinia frederiksenii]
MTTSRRLTTSLLLLVLGITSFSAPTLSAENPSQLMSRVSDHTLYANTVIDREILVGEVLQNYRKLSHAVILISGYQPAFNQLAYDIRAQLISANIPPTSIYLQPSSTGYDMRNRGLITLSLEQYRVAQYTCNYHRQDYQYRDRDKVGCSVDNLRNLSIINRK